MVFDERNLYEPALRASFGLERYEPRRVQDAVAGDPRVNIQDDKGKAKLYQVRQVLAAIAKLQGKTR